MKKIIAAALSFAAISATTLSADDLVPTGDTDSTVAQAETLKEAPLTVEGLVASFKITEEEALAVLALSPEDQAKKIAELQAAKAETETTAA